MAMKTKIASERGEKFKFENKGDQLEGYYLGSEQREINGDPVTVHNIKTDKGLFSPFGSYDLNRKLADMQNGVRVRITFNGKKSLGKGKTVKEFTVEYDEDDTIEAAPSAVTRPASTADKAAAFKAQQLKG